MARRLQATYQNNPSTTRQAKVYRDAEWQEWVVQFYRNGAKLTDASYHTTDEVDAHQTARHWVDQEPATLAR